MTLLKTKEAAQQLAVSETTIRRWVSLFPSSFPKDMFGHYIFDDAALEKLRRIKTELEEGIGLPDIKLPKAGTQTLTLEPQTAALPQQTAPLIPEASESLLIRISRLEASLSHKADEVVSFQLMHHRQELEDIRQTLAQLAASVEALYIPIQNSAAALASESAAASPAPAGGRSKRKRMLRAIFPFL
ncbi:MerR family transcriptional regulator [Paenibacillus sp. NEAU-GSW1]|uniref:MerR family transcriptional regulator n=1 Tax=Paenibacillus sp. NEAU-GSW1 TaxID=2682486 RepID=UPI0012E2652F|nr:MerR family transcriptional regulator [Paenibacillus sp. NEAU-GSW1]MUT64794.1 MerR family transcriptional regulator [Paenibacillus sp. NEAU-GSW1]